MDNLWVFGSGVWLSLNSFQLIHLLALCWPDPSSAMACIRCHSFFKDCEVPSKENVLGVAQCDGAAVRPLWALTCPRVAPVLMRCSWFLASTHNRFEQASLPFSWDKNRVFLYLSKKGINIIYSLFYNCEKFGQSLKKIFALFIDASYFVRRNRVTKVSWNKPMKSLTMFFST